MRTTALFGLCILGSACGAHRLHGQATSPPCLLTSPPKSTIAWQSAFVDTRGPIGRDELAGRVVWVQTGEAVSNARISLNPGEHYTVSDSTGRFSLRGLAQGHYLLRVAGPAAVAATDSITVGFDGALVVAALARYRPGDIGCSSPVRKPSNER
jgi:hypothetical protein